MSSSAIDDIVTQDLLVAAANYAGAHADHFVVIAFGFGVFERSWALRGFTDSIIDSVADTAFYGRLIGAIAEHQMQIVDRLLDLPVDGIMFSDDWGYQNGVLLGPDRWRRFLQPWADS